MTTPAPKQPKIVGYMSGLYDIMYEQASSLDDESGESLSIWQGRLIETCNSVGIPTGYYKKVVDGLRRLGCIEMLTRGTRGSTLTAVILRHPPTLEAYDEAIVKSGWKGLTAADSPDRLSAQVKEIQTRLGGIDWLGLAKNFEERISELETALKDLLSKTNSTTNNK